VKLRGRTRVPLYDGVGAVFDVDVVDHGSCVITGGDPGVSNHWSSLNTPRGVVLS